MAPACGGAAPVRGCFAHGIVAAPGAAVPMARMRTDDLLGAAWRRAG